MPKTEQGVRIDRGVINERLHFRLQPYNPRNRFEVYQRGKEDAVIVVSFANGARLSFPDFPVTIDGGENTLEEEEDQPRRLYLSPDGKRLLVEKHLDSTTNVGRAFVIEGNAVRSDDRDGQRLDEACVRYYCKTHGVPLAKVTGGGRDIFPIAWKGAAVGVIEIGSSRSGYRGSKDSSLFFQVEYDFSRRRFLGAHAIKPFR